MRGYLSEALYPPHVAELRRRYESAMDRLDLAAIVVGSGTMVFRFQDDQPHRFVANPLFVQWVPLLNYPDSSVIIRRGEQPVLVLARPEDFWHLPPALPEAKTAAQFEVRIISAPKDLTAHLPAEESRMALIGPVEQWDGIVPSAQRNPEPLLNFLHFHRARKTAWEVACLRRAAAIAAPGHHAAETAFREGGSEYDILIAFLSGCRQTEAELPYGAIVALNEHGATLHYQHREREVHRPRDIHSLLIDAGCQFNGYACDITRSYSYRQDEFAEMIADVDELQQQLCEAIQPGVAFPELHRRTHFAVGELLKRWDLVRMEPEHMVTRGITQLFFPHGLGHLLGLQVHDVGGHMGDESGAMLKPPDDFPKLRFLRALEPGHIVTMEPGIYFIESLLTTLNSGEFSSSVNWPKIATLRKFGGIRIEDDLLVTETGHENLTRPLLSH